MTLASSTTPELRCPNDAALADRSGVVWVRTSAIPATKPKGGSEPCKSAKRAFTWRTGIAKCSAGHGDLAGHLQEPLKPRLPDLQGASGHLQWPKAPHVILREDTIVHHCELRIIVKANIVDRKGVDQGVAPHGVDVRRHTLRLQDLPCAKSVVIQIGVVAAARAQ